MSAPVERGGFVAIVAADVNVDLVLRAGRIAHQVKHLHPRVTEKLRYSSPKIYSGGGCSLYACE